MKKSKIMIRLQKLENLLEQVENLGLDESNHKAIMIALEDEIQTAVMELESESA